MGISFADRKETGGNSFSVPEPDLLFAIGDIHGMLRFLKQALKEIEAYATLHNKTYRVIFLGDLIDRGHDIKGVVELVKSLCLAEPLKYVCLMGNHEWMLLNSYRKPKDVKFSYWEVWVGNGGKATYDSYDILYLPGIHNSDNIPSSNTAMDEHMDWMETLPFRHETENYIFVHAGLNPQFPANSQSEQECMWIRFWEDANVDFGKHVVYGHTARLKPELWPHTTGLDTGACGISDEGMGTLSVGIFDAKVNKPPIGIIAVSRKG